MATLRQTTERLLDDDELPYTNPISVRDLIARFQPTPRDSLRSLQQKMFEWSATQLPWAVILCRFKGAPANPAKEEAIESFYRRAFTRGTGGLVEYWRDASLGNVDISRSRVFGWIEVDLPRNQADARSGATRSTLVDAAIAAVKRDGMDPVTGFHSQLSVYTENWSIDGVPPGLDWSDPVWGKYWIDGSADGRGKVSLTPPHNANIVAHEMGHSFGMHHDLGPDLVAHYGDPCCIMSQHNAFVNPTWGVAFGPALCLPHLVLKDWMYRHRVRFLEADWVSESGGVSTQLAALTDPGARTWLGLKFPLWKNGGWWDYYVEYVTPTEWNRGLGKAFVMVRRLAPFGTERSTAFLGAIEVPTGTTVVDWLEPAGNLGFKVERSGADGRTVKVNVIRH